jgi:hypothetical protein
MADYSIGSTPLTLQQQLQAIQTPSVSSMLPANFNPAAVDYSLGQQGGMSVAGMGGGQGLRSGGMNTWGQGSAAGNSSGSGFGMNMPTLALGLQGLNSFGSLYMGAKSLGLADKQFESAQKFANINLANQTKSYNDTLENKIKRIGSFNGTSAADTAAEYERRKLTGQA